MAAIIEDVKARKIFDSRGDVTIEVEIITAEGLGIASAPSGASKGKAEVVAYPKGGVEEAIRKVEELIAPELIGMSADEQEEIDNLLHELDGTENFMNIGGNTAYAISLAVADAAANSYSMPLFQYLGGHLACQLPYPLGNVLGGGRHALGKVPDIQEFLVLPLGAKSFIAAAEANINVHRRVRDLLVKADPNFTGGRGDEGAWAPRISNEMALEIVSRACEEVSNEIGFECRLGLDMASSTLWNPEKQRYIYANEGVERDTGAQIEYVLSLIEKYKLVYVEDPLYEDDFEGFRELTLKAKGCLICGDDLFATNEKRLKVGVEMKAGNAVIIKVNQVGTLTDSLKTIMLAKENNYIPVISHRSGETTSSHIAHIAVGFGCPIIKTGVVGGERLAKINELIYIEEILNKRARMARLKI
ncbi:MAG: phosphopyruvate hydratase [Candidatus Bathyarchaeia archaeon]